MSVLVVLEQTRGVFHRMSWEALAAAAELGLSVSAVVIGEAGEAATKAIDRLYTIPEIPYSAEGYTAVLAALIAKVQPTYVLFPHTYQVRDYAPKLATRLGRVLVSDVLKLNADGTAVRQHYQGKMNSTYQFTTPGLRLLSIQAGAYRPDSVGAGAPAIETFLADPGPVRVEAEAPFRESSRAVDLTAAEIIVSVGRGIQEKENLILVEELAEALGAEIAASRPICDNGWLPMERQVGSSGQTVAPKLYVAVGISGAIQHLVGMKGAKTIVAINKDPNAPIFEVADYGVVGDLFEVLPPLTEAITQLKS